MYSDIKAAVMGSINMDIILKADRLPEVGENVLGTEYSYACGGKGANQAIGLSRLGAKTKMIGKVADDTNGNRLIDNLIKNNVDASGVSKEGSSTGLAAILIDGDGKNRIIVYECANAEIDPEEAASHVTDDTDILLVQFETKEDVVEVCVNTAIKKGIMTVVDCGPAKNFSVERMQGMTIITPNENETEALTGIFPEKEEDALRASEILYGRCKPQFVVLKLGSKGCSCYDGKNIHFLPSYPTVVRDTTAAGDSFTAALALEYKRSGDILKACDVGNRAGSIAVSRVGAENSMPTAEEILSTGADNL